MGQMYDKTPLNGPILLQEGILQYGKKSDRQNKHEFQIFFFFVCAF